MSLMLQALKDPDSLQQKPTFEGKLGEFRLAWYFYKRKMLAAGEDWTYYLTSGDYYQHTRMIFNPVPNVIDFYVDNIWSNAQSEKYPKLVTPVSFADNEDMFEAVAQIDQWTNWRKEQQTVKAYVASSGSALVEIIDDLDRQKITQKTHWIGYVKGITLNDAGDVVQYALEYKVYDPVLKEDYTFQKIVTKEKISYFKNDNPFDYGNGAEMENPYGFCPAVLFRHSGSGTEGEAAFTDFDKVLYTNSKACHLYDNIDKEIESGKVISGITSPSDVVVISGGDKNKDGSVTTKDSRLHRILLGVPGNATVSDLSGMLKLAEAHPYLRDLIVSFGDDYPELEYRQIMKEKGGDVSGTALERLLTPAQNRLDRAAPNYDEQHIKCRQMQVAIAGWRTKNGWTRRSKQQQVFSGFGLDSYQNGLLDFNLKRSVLIESTEHEREELYGLKLDNANKAKDILPLDEIQNKLGYDEEARGKLTTAMSKERGLFETV